MLWKRIKVREYYRLSWINMQTGLSKYMRDQQSVVNYGFQRRNVTDIPYISTFFPYCFNGANFFFPSSLFTAKRFRHALVGKYLAGYRSINYAVVVVRCEYFHASASFNLDN